MSDAGLILDQTDDGNAALSLYARDSGHRHLREYSVKGFLMDDERLKNPSGLPDYFDGLLARIRDIRASV